jgi:hypothetical protein
MKRLSLSQFNGLPYKSVFDHIWERLEWLEHEVDPHKSPYPTPGCAGNLIFNEENFHCPVCSHVWELLK